MSSYSIIVKVSSLKYLFVVVVVVTFASVRAVVSLFALISI